MSSFRRTKSPSSSSSVRISGVKNWINGQSLVSTGHKQQDEIFGGGIALGTVLLVEEDRFSNFSETLIAYSIAEAIIHGHKTLLLCPAQEDVEKTLGKLPFALSASSNSSETPPETGIQQQTKNGLKIAWQYGKYLDPGCNPATEQNLSRDPSVTGHSSAVYCNSFDCSRSLQENICQGNPVRTLSTFPHMEDPVDFKFDLAAILKQIVSTVVSCIHSLPPNIVTRIYIPNLFGFSEYFDLDNTDAMASICRSLLALKQLVRGTNAIITISVRPHTTPRYLLRQLSQLADTAVCIESFAGKEESIPYEFREFSGFFIVRKQQQIGALAPHRAPHSKYGIKRDRRKLHIEPLHLPPEDSRALASSAPEGRNKASTGTAKSSDNTSTSHPPLVPGLACSSHGGFGDKSLDF
eukprot:gene11747-24632_t